MDHARETLTWETFGDAAQGLARVIAGDGFRPDLILAIARGGMFVAGALGYALSVKNLHLMNVEFYNGVGSTLDMPVRAGPELHPRARGRRALGRGIREARVPGEVRVRVEAHRPVDQLPVVEPAAGGARGTRRVIPAGTFIRSI